MFRALERISVRASAWLSVAALFACESDDTRGDLDAGGDAAVGALDASADSSARSDGGEQDSDANGALQAVTLRFKAKVGREDFACGRVYADQGSTKVSATPQDFRFYVQSVRLIGAGGQEVPVALDERSDWQTSDVALLDFTTTDGNCSAGNPATNTIVTGKVPAGSYAGVIFVNGVPDSLNHIDFAVAPEPLRDPSTSWNWLLGYRFLLAELLHVPGASSADAGAPPDGGADAGLSDGGTSGLGIGVVHVGSTECSGSAALGFRCSKANRNEVRLLGFDPAANSIVADLGAIFASSDLSRETNCHSTGEQCAPLFAAVGVDYASGAPAATQLVFRVE